MMRFLQENWFKFGVLVILIVFGLSSLIIQSKNNTILDVADSLKSQDKSIGHPEIKNEKREIKDVVPSTYIYKESAVVKNKEATVLEKKEDNVPVVTTGNAVYNRQEFTKSISRVYIKMNVDFNQYNKEINQWLKEKNITQASSFVNSAFQILSEQRDAINSIEKNYPNLNLEDSKALFNIKKSVDYYFISQNILKSIASRQNFGERVTDADLEDIYENNYLGYEYLKDVYNYLVLNN